MKFSTLDDISTTALSDAFNNAFEGYAVPMRMSEKQLEQKIYAENIDLNRSVGAFDDDGIVGFILIGIDTINGIKTAWEGGTGVIKGYRGKRLSVKMYEYIFPILKDNGVERILLEMLETNDAMYKIHSDLGFKVLRKLHAYKGKPTGKPKNNHQVEIISNPDIEALKKLSSWQPAWQQMNKRVIGWGDRITTAGIRNNDNIVAYVHYDGERKRVFQFAVHNDHKRQGMASSLFNYIGKDLDAISVINVDENATEADAFLKAIGLENFISQYEMSMDI